MATPFFDTQYGLGGMQLDRSLLLNLRFACYPSDHIVYLDIDALHTMHTHLARLHDEAAHGGGGDDDASSRRSR